MDCKAINKGFTSGLYQLLCRQPWCSWAVSGLWLSLWVTVISLMHLKIIQHLHLPQFHRSSFHHQLFDSQCCQDTSAKFLYPSQNRTRKKKPLFFWSPLFTLESENMVILSGTGGRNCHLKASCLYVHHVLVFLLLVEMKMNTNIKKLNKSVEADKSHKSH